MGPILPQLRLDANAAYSIPFANPASRSAARGALKDLVNGKKIKPEMAVEFVVYGGESPLGCPTAIWEDLCRIGLPGVGVNIFTPAPTPVLISSEREDVRADGIVLGYSRENVELYLEFSSGNVFLLWAQEAGQAFVNTSIGAFRESILQVDARYPFYPSHRDLDMAYEAEDALRQMLVGIDEASTANPDGYWSSFLDDVAVGDYAAPPLGEPSNE